MSSRQRRVGRCIYCHQVKPYGKEHYLPISLGVFRGFETLNDRICTDCNNSFSDIEKDFSRKSPEAFHRKLLGIKGRKHHRPHNPFQEEYSREIPIVPIEVLGRPPGTNLEALWEPNEGQNTMQPMCQIVLRESNDNIRHIRITAEMLENPSQLEDAIGQIDFDNAQEVCFFASSQEGEKIEQASRKVFPKKELFWKEPPEGDIQIDILGLFTISPKYVRAIAKIAFHYFLKHFPRYIGDEPCFEDVRQFIQSGGNIRSSNDIEKFVRFTRNPIITGINPGSRQDWQGHLLAASVDYVGFHVKAGFFVGEGPDVTYEVFLGENPSRIEYEETCRHKFIYFDETHNDENFSGEIQEI